jgi:hypothetical protein
MKVTDEFREVASDLIAKEEGFEVIEPGRLYTKRLMANSYIVLEKNKDHLYSCYKLKRTHYATDVGFSHALAAANKETKIADGLEDWIDWCREMEEEDKVVDFQAKAKRRSW